MAKASKSGKYVYSFGNKKADGDGSMKPLLGGKGANLAEMSRIGLPVPPGFTITTEVCTYFYANKRTYPKVLEAQSKEGGLVSTIVTVWLQVPVLPHKSVSVQVRVRTEGHEPFVTVPAMATVTLVPLQVS